MIEVHQNLQASSTLPVLQATETEVCGLVDPKKPDVEKRGRKVRVEKDGKSITTGVTGADGTYCVMLGKTHKNTKCFDFKKVGRQNF